MWYVCCGGVEGADKGDAGKETTWAWGIRSADDPGTSAQLLAC